MRLDDWHTEILNEAAKFVAAWKQRAEIEPTMYPLELGSGDWDEQFHSFCDSES